MKEPSVTTGYTLTGHEQVSCNVAGCPICKEVEPSVETKIEQILAEAYGFSDKMNALVAQQIKAQMRESLIERLQEELVGCSDHKTLDMVLNILEEK